MNVTANCDRYEQQLGEMACFFREIALEVDESPDAILNYRSASHVQKIALYEHDSPIERVKFYEAAGYGDAGVCLACPGPSLSGLLIRELGTKEQSEYFHRYVAQQQARTFLAVTEPRCGSNLTCMNSTIRKINSCYRLNSEKWLVGQGATGTIGVLIAKLTAGPLGLCALLITPQLLSSHKNIPDSFIERSIIPMTGLRGARLGRLKFKNIILSKDVIIGGQVSAIERGMMALIKTFNCMRPCIGALAIGTAQALIDYLYAVKKSFNQHENRILSQLKLHLLVAREAIHFAANKYKDNPYECEHSSLAKVESTQVLEKVAETVRFLLGRDVLIEHPLVTKWNRDSFGFEYMEGTQVIQKLNIYNGFRKKLL